MKLARLHLGDMVCIPLGRDNGSGQPRSDMRDQSFSVEDGWELTRGPTDRVFRIWREGMPDIVAVDEFGNSWVEVAPAEVSKKAKR